jgi:hypothetical protein
MKKIIILASVVLIGWLGYNSASNNRGEGSFLSPSQRTEPVHISIITDIDRCATRSFATGDNLARFVQFANSAKDTADGKVISTGASDFAVSLGDNIAHRLESCSITATEDLAFVGNALSTLTMPLHYVLGDHDIASEPDTLTTWRAHTGREETFYSFDHGDVHIIVLDTILGGNSLLSCEDDSACTVLLTEKTALEEQLMQNVAMASQDQTSDLKDTPQTVSSGAVSAEKLGKKDVHRITARLRSLDLVIDEYKKNATHLASDDIRDHGLIGKKQLLWLAHDLASTQQTKVLILADHPLFPYTTIKKSYEIADLEALTTILHDARDTGKEIVTVSGEAHAWHKSVRDGIVYHVVDQFRSKEGSWAHAVWDDTFTLYRVRQDKIFKALE